MSVSSLQLKASLMYYFRFKRQWICADEVDFNWGRADILVDTGKDVIEVEVKISKSDLFDGEARKSKHGPNGFGLKCNRFYVAVPEYLLEDAKAWCEQVNPKYGVLLHTGFLDIMVARTAKPLREDYNPEIRERIVRRLSSKAYDSMRKELQKELDKV